MKIGREKGKFTSCLPRPFTNQTTVITGIKNTGAERATSLPVPISRGRVKDKAAITTNPRPGCFNNTSPPNPPNRRKIIVVETRKDKKAEKIRIVTIIMTLVIN
jgi:hypothetical protein